MRYSRIFVFFLLLSVLALSNRNAVGEEKRSALFPDLEARERFTSEVSGLLESAWKKWQDSVLIDNISVEGSYGLLMPGDMGGPVLKLSDMMNGFSRKGKSQDYIDCVKAVTGAVANGMRLWQRGYSHKNIPFPQGASCTYTMPPSSNVPVTVGSGRSYGDKIMTEKALYNYMLYRVPRYEEDVLVVFRGSAKGVSECFIKWKKSCSIIGIIASGGVAPQPAPMGTGPGPVRGARGRNGKLVGPYFNGQRMKEILVQYFRQQEG
ncbi:MAG: hypothetical protein U9R44_07250 [Candidatus Omnitrophota bacterium]|nr:hypothetical protein [Candidatus Omnitrophota bacterium]